MVTHRVVLHISLSLTRLGVLSGRESSMRNSSAILVPSASLNRQHSAAFLPSSSQGIFSSTTKSPYKIFAKALKAISELRQHFHKARPFKMQKLLTLALALFSLSGFSVACSVSRSIKLTNYGFPDASGTPAYKCRGGNVVATRPGDKTELGDGSSGNPYPAAAAGNSVFKKCDLLYVPLLKKYFRVQDDCSGCGTYRFPYI